MCDYFIVIALIQPKEEDSNDKKITDRIHRNNEISYLVQTDIVCLPRCVTVDATTSTDSIITYNDLTPPVLESGESSPDKLIMPRTTHYNYITADTQEHSNIDISHLTISTSSIAH